MISTLVLGKLNILTLWTVLMLFVVSPSEAADGTNLKFVTVVFRHGDRAPDPPEMYPKDPHYNNTFYPMGLGGLTNAGKLREYNLGLVLRDRYNDLLGQQYLPSAVLAQSTDYIRTKMCLQLVLAAIYPPKNKQKWNDKLDWQPIPVSYFHSKRDWLLIPEECPEYLAERKKVESMSEVIEKKEKFRDAMKTLTELTGKNITGTYDFYMLYHLLTAESTMNLPLPAWTKDFYPRGKILDGILFEYELFSYSQTLRRLNGGKLLYQLIDDMNAVRKDVNNTLKIVLYSGHESNIVGLLQTLGAFDPHVPEYSSAIMVELYEKSNQYYVKLMYYLGIPSTSVALKIPGCEILCPLDKFINLLRDVTPSANELSCDKSKVETYASKM